MTPQDPSTPPPPLSTGGTPSGGLPTAPFSTPPPASLPGSAAEDVLPDAPTNDAARPKVDYGQMLRDNKLYLAAWALVLVLVVGFGVWYASLSATAEHQAPVSPISASAITSITDAPRPPDPMTPVDAAEASANRDRTKGVDPDASIMMAEGASADPAAAGAVPGDVQPTAKEREDYRRQMALTAHANNIDSTTVTKQEAGTGRFVQTRVARQRVPVSTGAPHYRPQPRGYAGGQPLRRSAFDTYPAGSFSGTTPQNQGAPRYEAPRPKYDTDGVPFETNDEINLMIAGLPDEVKAQYEKMSGKRYRPLPAGTQQRARDSRTEMAYVPGMDGFNTIRFRGTNGAPDAEEAPPVPDIFYRCSIQGTQQVRSGSVVVLRLTEDATFGGITFPRNMTFSALASVEPYRVTLTIDRLGPHRVRVQTFNYAYMPGIMIDPGKRAPAPGGGMSGALQQSSTQELSNAIAQSNQAANSLTGIGGRVAVSMINRLPRAGAKLRIVTLPDGYPLLLSKATAGGAGAAGAAAGLIQGGVNTAGGIMGQDGNPFQSLLMSGQGIGGFSGQQGAVPPLYYPVTPGAARQAVQQAVQQVGGR